MAIQNDIQPPAGGGSRTFEEPVSSGIYFGAIKTVEECEIPPFKGEGDPRAGIRFVVEISNGGKTIEGKHEVTASLGERAKLRKLLDVLVPGQLQAAIGVQGQVKKLINSLEGKDVQVIVAEKVSQKGTKYSIIEGIMPGNGQAPQVGGNEKLEGPGFDSDDIPF